MQTKDWSTPPYVQWHFSYKKNPPLILQQRATAKLDQVHGDRLVKASLATQKIQKADAVWTDDHTVCAIRTADCIPILFTDQQGQCVGAIHAGWRGLAKQIIVKTFSALKPSAASWLIWIGPHIRQPAFEVRDDLKKHFPDQDAAFQQISAQHYLCNLQTLALNQLYTLGIQDHQITTNTICTFSNPESMYSYRRSPGLAERHISQIWKTI